MNWVFESVFYVFESLRRKQRELEAKKEREKIYYIEITDNNGQKRQIECKYNGDQNQAQKIAEIHFTVNDFKWELKTRKNDEI